MIPRVSLLRFPLLHSPPPAPGQLHKQQTSVPTRYAHTRLDRTYKSIRVSRARLPPSSVLQSVGRFNFFLFAVCLSLICVSGRCRGYGRVGHIDDESNEERRRTHRPPCTRDTWFHCAQNKDGTRVLGQRRSTARYHTISRGNGVVIKLNAVPDRSSSFVSSKILYYIYT